MALAIEHKFKTLGQERDPDVPSYRAYSPPHRRSTHVADRIRPRKGGKPQEVGTLALVVDARARGAAVRVTGITERRGKPSTHNVRRGNTFAAGAGELADYLPSLSQSGPQLVQRVLANGPGPQWLLSTQSVSGHAFRDRLHLVRSEALELRRVHHLAARPPLHHDCQQRA